MLDLVIQKPTGETITLSLSTARTLEELVNTVTRRLSSKKEFKNCTVTISANIATRPRQLVSLQVNDTGEVTLVTYPLGIDPTEDLSHAGELTLAQDLGLSTALVSFSGADAGAGAASSSALVPATRSTGMALSSMSSETLVDGIPTKFQVKAIKDPHTGSYFLFPCIQMATTTKPEFNSAHKHFIFVTDDSGSMGTGGRLSTQKAIVKALYEDLPEGTEVSLISIRTTATTVLSNIKKTPETRAEFMRAVDASYSENTDFYGAFIAAKTAIESSSIPSSATTIVLCSDGGDSGQKLHAIFREKITDLSSATPDLKTKVLIDDFAGNPQYGIPAIPFVFFTDRDNTGTDHLKVLAALSLRSKQPGIIVEDRSSGAPLNPDVLGITTQAIIQATVNGHHLYMDRLGTKVNEVTRDLPNGSTARYLGIVNPGTSCMTEMLEVTAETFEAQSGTPIQAILSRGERSTLVTANIELVEDHLQKDDLLFFAIKQRLAKLYSQDPQGQEEGTRSLIESDVMPRIRHLLEGSRKTELLADVALYTASTPTHRSDSYGSHHQSHGPQRAIERFTAPAAGSGSTQLFLKTVSGTTFTMDVSSAMTIAQLKLEIQEVHGFDASQLRLIFEGKSLTDDQTISGTNLASGTVVRLVNTKPFLGATPPVAPEAIAGAGAASSVAVEAVRDLTINLNFNGRVSPMTLPSNSTVEQAIEKLTIESRIDAASMRVSLYAPRSGGVPLASDCRLDTLDLTQEFLCQITPRSLTVNQVMIHCSVSGGQSGQVSISGDLSVLTVEDLKRAINAQLCGSTLRNLNDLGIIVNGQVITNSRQKLQDIQWSQASRVNVVIRRRDVRVEAAGVMQAASAETFASTSTNDSTVTILTAGRGQETHTFDRTRPLRELLSAMFGTTTGLDDALRTIGLGLELDLDRSLAELGYGRNCTFAFEGSNSHAAFRWDNRLEGTSSTTLSTLVHREPSAVALMSAAPMTSMVMRASVASTPVSTSSASARSAGVSAGGSGAASLGRAAGVFSSSVSAVLSKAPASSRNYTLEDFKTGYRAARRAQRFSNPFSTMKDLIDKPDLDFNQVFNAAKSGSHLTLKVLAAAGVIDFTAPAVGTKEIRVPLILTSSHGSSHGSSHAVAHP